ncbi:hypothetical protein Agub_g10768 [Astrephomene gubernaculifera]|uniref:Uncharacterized protein n=1 Tax=Astrephomene gubernaculifera TaxID=47775 RepID=A0AAD3HQ46_9CHLO|nr:hypothetical protein Agub_g10768 [Astrephomene gubernaculifera]
MSLDKVLQELASEGTPKLKHIDQVADRSTPAIGPDAHVGHWDKGQFLKEVESGCPLKHVEDPKDRSEPRIEGKCTRIIPHFHHTSTSIPATSRGHLSWIPTNACASLLAPAADVQLHPSNRAAHLAEVKALGGHHALLSELSAASQAGGPALAHVEAPADRSAPVVEGAHVGKWDKSGFLQEIQSPPQLKHVERTADRSVPKVEPGVQVKRNSHHELLSEIRTSSPQALRHVQDTADRSEPRVTHTAALRVTAERQ